jgi:hypothetical protein
MEELGDNLPFQAYFAVAPPSSFFNLAHLWLPISIISSDILLEIKSTRCNFHYFYPEDGGGILLRKLW